MVYSLPLQYSNCVAPYDKYKNLSYTIT